MKNISLYSLKCSVIMTLIAALGVAIYFTVINLRNDPAAHHDAIVVSSVITLLAIFFLIFEITTDKDDSIQFGRAYPFFLLLLAIIGFGFVFIFKEQFLLGLAILAVGLFSSLLFAGLDTVRQFTGKPTWFAK